MSEKNITKIKTDDVIENLLLPAQVIFFNPGDSAVLGLATAILG